MFNTVVSRFSFSLFALIPLFFSSNIFAETDCQAFDSGMVNHYKFDSLNGGSVVDEIGGANGISSNIQLESGVFETSAKFGALSKLSLGAYNVNTTGRFSISMWVNPASNNTVESRFFSKAYGIEGDEHYLMVGNYNKSALRFRLRTNQVTTTLISPENILVDNVWSLVTVTYDQRMMRIFHNGGLVAQVAKSGSIANSNTVNAAIGNQPSGAGSRVFVGKIDDLRVYNRALTGNDITGLFALRDSQCNGANQNIVVAAAPGPQPVAQQPVAETQPQPVGAPESQPETTPQPVAQPAPQPVIVPEPDPVVTASNAQLTATVEMTGSANNVLTGTAAAPSDSRYGVSISGGRCPGIPESFPNTYVVSTIQEMKSAYSIASPGEAIIVRNGTYSWTMPQSNRYSRGTRNPFAMERSGTAAAPIYIIPESLHGVTFQNSAVGWVLAGSHNVFAGFNFVNAKGFFVVGPDNRVACNNFSQKTNYLVSENQGADRLEFDNNDINNAANFGIVLWRCDPAGRGCPRNSKGAHIHHNTFRNKSYQNGENGHEAIVLGVGYNPVPGTTIYNTDNENMEAVVENNLFDRWDGEEELISIKSSKNVIRNNCVVNSSRSQFVVRGGYDNLITGNWIENSGPGWIIAGKRNTVAFNYHSKNGVAAFRLHIGEQSRPGQQAGLSSHYQYIEGSDNILEKNVFNRFNYAVQAQTRLGWILISEPTGNSIKDNAFYSTGFSGSGNSGGYVNDDGRLSEAEFRRTNNWGENTVYDMTLPASVCGNSTLFDGPGGRGASVRGGSNLLGAPERIFAPSWW